MHGELVCVSVHPSVGGRPYLPPGRTLGLGLLARWVVRHMQACRRRLLVEVVAGLLLGNELVVEGLKVL